MLKDLTKNRWKFAIIPAAIIVIGIIFGIIHQSHEGYFNFDVEFIGGTRMQIDLKQTFDNDEIAALVQEATPDATVNATVQKGENDNIVIIKVPSLGDAAVTDGDAAGTSADDQLKNQVLTALKNKYNGETVNALKEKYTITEETVTPENIGELKEKYSITDEDAAAFADKYLTDDNVISVNSASASFGQEVQRKAILFTLIAIICILIYIAIRFEWRSAVMAVIALAINVLIMASVYTVTYIPLNTTFIAAMLTVIGYSINNTIVIFDRIRENQKTRKKDESIASMVDRSIMETMGRTINSTITTLITIVLIYILGASSIRDFSLPLIIGIVAGAYTSIFLASTFWAAWKESEMKAKAIAAQDRRTNKSKKK